MTAYNIQGAGYNKDRIPSHTEPKLVWITGTYLSLKRCKINTHIHAAEGTNTEIGEDLKCCMSGGCERRGCFIWAGSFSEIRIFKF